MELSREIRGGRGWLRQEREDRILLSVTAVPVRNPSKKKSNTF